MIFYYLNVNCALFMLFVDLINITTQETLISTDVTKSIIGIQHGIGRRMCERECSLRQNECQSITFDSEHFVCRLHGSPTSSEWSLNDNYRAVNASEFSQIKLKQVLDMHVSCTKQSSVILHPIIFGKEFGSYFQRIPKDAARWIDFDASGLTFQNIREYFESRNFQMRLKKFIKPISPKLSSKAVLRKKTRVDTRKSYKRKTSCRRSKCYNNDNTNLCQGLSNRANSGKCANIECLTDEKCVEVGNSAKCVQIGFPRDCKDIYQFFSKESGMYITYPFLPNATKTISVCDMDHAEGGYTMVQRRLDGSINFTRNWIEYENGFGNLESDFWIGNTVLHTLTSMGSTLLHIKLQGHNDNWKYAEYSTFSVADSTDNYRMAYTGYSGTAGNSIDNCDDAQFTTYDKDHDTHSTNCALIRGQGGWWFKSCCRSNLNGVYCTSGENNAEKCNRWYYFSNNNVGMKTSLMLIRRND